MKRKPVFTMSPRLARTRRLPMLLILLVLPLVSVGTATPAHAYTNTSTSFSGTIVEAINLLPVASEVRTGYSRDLFKLWVDADKDCLDTRQEVLQAESVITPTIASCRISGKWYSYYDQVYTTDQSTFDIDHMVPLAEAWDSGARLWTSNTRERYANDLGDPRPLVAVTASSNRSKGDSDPAEWLPTYSKCRYVAEWTAVKTRWRLSINSAEKTALLSVANSCASQTITVTKATVTLA